MLRDKLGQWLTWTRMHWERFQWSILRAEASRRHSWAWSWRGPPTQTSSGRRTDSYTGQIRCPCPCIALITVSVREKNMWISIMSLIPSLSHRLLYVTFRTFSWSWVSSPTNTWFPCVRFIHNYTWFQCVSCKLPRSTVEIRITNGCAWLKHNLHLISRLPLSS